MKTALVAYKRSCVSVSSLEVEYPGACHTLSVVEGLYIFKLLLSYRIFLKKCKTTNKQYRVGLHTSYIEKT